MGLIPHSLFTLSMKYLKDKRDGDLWGWNPYLATNPNFEEIEVESFPKSDLAEKPKRKSYKDILREKAQALNGGSNDEASMGQA